MPLPTRLVSELSQGTAYTFGSWPNSAVPTYGAGVYTVWHGDGRFITRFENCDLRSNLISAILERTPQFVPALPDCLWHTALARRCAASDRSAAHAPQA